MCMFCPPGYARVLWTNYEYALVAECFDRQDDGTCPPGAFTMVIFGRTSNIPEHVIDGVIPIGTDTCVKSTDFERVPHLSKYSLYIPWQDSHI